MSPLDPVATPYAPAYQHRPTIVGARGAVASASPLAAVAGLQVLAEGGNAVDAAVCVAAVECVTLPMLCGLGGEAFAVVHAPGRPIRALSSSGVAPVAVSADDYRRRGLTLLPFAGAESVAVPGEVAAYATLLAAYGSMPLADLLAPAIAYADDGFVVSDRVARQIATAAALLAQFPSSAAIFLPAGRPPNEGDLLRQPDLARSLRRIADGGAAAFYRGELTETMLAAL
ncbi:MAG: gamma-glutamyltransferase, partial [Dehalococcoidia bacterium]|nr:gamma-glutamyltransferase [Dehalococcoidia bacterium]